MRSGLVLVLGGARSGKSAYAERLVVESGLDRVYLATAEAGDLEMSERIAHHQARRGEGWRTVEEPSEVERVLMSQSGEGRAILVDCLTLWLSNLMLLRGRHGNPARPRFATRQETCPASPCSSQTRSALASSPRRRSAGSSATRRAGSIRPWRKPSTELCSWQPGCPSFSKEHHEHCACPHPGNHRHRLSRAGKTTLIRHLLQNPGGRRIALIVNEFGDVGFDGSVLADCGSEACAADDIIELSNGCICCTVADDFLPAMEKILGRAEPPDHIVIETSGLALPQPLVKAFTWPSVKNRVTVDGVVTVVDATAVAEGRVASDEAKLAEQRAKDLSLDHDDPVEELVRGSSYAALT
jgi:hypothetical protein